MCPSVGSLKGCRALGFFAATCGRAAAARVGFAWGGVPGLEGHSRRRGMPGANRRPSGCGAAAATHWRDEGEPSHSTFSPPPRAPHAAMPLAPRAVPNWPTSNTRLRIGKAAASREWLSTAGSLNAVVSRRRRYAPVRRRLFKPAGSASRLRVAKGVSGLRSAGQQRGSPPGTESNDGSQGCINASPRSCEALSVVHHLPPSPSPGQPREAA